MYTEKPTSKATVFAEKRSSSQVRRLEMRLRSISLCKDSEYISRVRVWRNDTFMRSNSGVLMGSLGTWKVGGHTKEF